jgi:hypothetical protein
MSLFTPIYRHLVRRWHEHEQQAALAGMRWQLLRALRSLSLGAILIVRVDPLTAERQVVLFEGQLAPQLVGHALLTRQWVQPNRPHWVANSMFYRLSPLGTQALEAGLRWWKSQPIHRRLILRLIE